MLVWCSCTYNQSNTFLCHWNRRCSRDVDDVGITHGLDPFLWKERQKWAFEPSMLYQLSFPTTKKRKACANRSSAILSILAHWFIQQSCTSMDIQWQSSYRHSGLKGTPGANRDTYPIFPAIWWSEKIFFSHNEMSLTTHCIFFLWTDASIISLA